MLCSAQHLRMRIDKGPKRGHFVIGVSLFTDALAFIHIYRRQNAGHEDVIFLTDTFKTCFSLSFFLYFSYMINQRSSHV